jgi:hypothetical protein
MKDWFDKESLICMNCGHVWLLVSNKLITDEQHYNWMDKVKEQHIQIMKEKGEI